MDLWHDPLRASPTGFRMTDVNNTISDRQRTHGNYEDVAQTYDELVRIARACPSFMKMNAPQSMSTEMIMHKLARALNGDPNFTDHWHDIEGYAALARRACRKEPS